MLLAPSRFLEPESPSSTPVFPFGASPRGLSSNVKPVADRFISIFNVLKLSGEPDVDSDSPQLFELESNSGVPEIDPEEKKMTTNAPEPPQESSQDNDEDNSQNSTEAKTREDDSNNAHKKMITRLR
jgi:hypothetical protein